MGLVYSKDAYPVFDVVSKFSLKNHTSSTFDQHRLTTSSIASNVSTVLNTVAKLKKNYNSQNRNI